MKEKFNPAITVVAIVDDESGEFKQIEEDRDYGKLLEYLRKKLEKSGIKVKKIGY